MPRRRWFKVLLLLFVALASGVGYVMLEPLPSPVMVSVSRVEKNKDSKRVIVSFVRHDSEAHFDGKQEYQLRQGGRWQSPQSFPEAQLDCLTDLRSNSEVALEVPLQTEACRFVLHYQAGGASRTPAYCKVYGFLSRHGIRKAYPALSQKVLNCIPTILSPVESTTCEVEVP